MHQVIQPDGWLPAKGYANGVHVHNGTLYVGGQIGWNAQQQFETHDFIGQMRQALRNILDVVEKAGGQASDIVRLTWYVTDKREYLGNLKELGRAYKATIGRHYPAMALVQVVALVEDRAKVEIEATAVVPD